MSIDRPGPATLGNLADQGMDVWAWCNGCFKNGAVATDVLIARLGRGFPVPNVGARMRCSCGPPRHRDAARLAGQSGGRDAA
jgi:hypothetical protein